MRVVLQRVSYASVSVSDSLKSEIGDGILILLGIELEDTLKDVSWLVKKISHLRIFMDKSGVMNKSITEVDGEAMVISQFTLHAKTRKGKRPSYIRAAKPDQAIPLYQYFLSELSIMIGKEVKSGEFGAHMQVNIINDGPVTIIIDSKRKE